MRIYLKTFTSPYTDTSQRVQSVPDLGKHKQSSFQTRDRVYERFRVKNDLLMSEMDDMNEVEHDEDISSDEEKADIPLRRQKTTWNMLEDEEYVEEHTQYDFV